MGNKIQSAPATPMYIQKPNQTKNINKQLPRPHIAIQHTLIYIVEFFLLSPYE